MTSNHHAPYVLGDTRATMAVTEGSEGAIRSETPKAAPVRTAASNRGSECRGECVPGSCTHRPSHHGSRGCPKSVERLPKAKLVTGVKS